MCGDGKPVISEQSEKQWSVIRARDDQTPFVRTTETDHKLLTTVH